jgi:hypothetical protein
MSDSLGMDEANSGHNLLEDATCEIVVKSFSHLTVIETFSVFSEFRDDVESIHSSALTVLDDLSFTS